MLESNEKILWQAEIVGSKITFLKVFFKIILGFLFIFGLPLVISFIYVLFAILFQDYSLILKIVLSLVGIFALFKLFVWLTRFNTNLIGFFITDKKLIFIVPGRYSTYPFFSDFEDIDYFEKLDKKNGEYQKYLIRSYTYGYLFNMKFIKLLKTYITFYLDGKGLEIFTKLLKEKSPNAEIKE